MPDFYLTGDTFGVVVTTPVRPVKGECAWCGSGEYEWCQSDCIADDILDYR